MNALKRADGRGRAPIGFLLGVLIVAWIVSFLPTLYGYISCPPDQWFSGVVYNMHDTGQYLSWAREAGTSFFTDNKLTAEPNSAVFVNLHWWLPGRLAAWLSLGFASMYQIYRLVAVALLVVVNWAFMAHLFADRQRRRFAFLLSLVGAGLGWIWIVLKYATGGAAPFFPRDIYTTPGNNLWVMIGSPHLTLAAGLTAAALLLALWAVERRRAGLVLIAGGVALFLGLGHIYDLVTVWGVLGLFGLLRIVRPAILGEEEREGLWNRVWEVLPLGLVVLISAPAALYWGWVSSDAHPAWQEALAQYDNLGVFTPSPPHLLILLGLPFLLALVALFRRPFLRDQDDRWLLVRAWFVLVPFLVYLPVRFQIMLLTGYGLPVAALATRALFDHLLPWLERRGRRWAQIAPVAFLVLAALTNVYLWSWRFVDLSRHTYPFYLHRDEVAALAWLEENTPPDEVVLSSFVVGHFLPGLSGDRAFLGNAVMTMEYNRKMELVQAFFHEGLDDEARAALLEDYQVRYVLHGPAERAIGAYDLASSSLFTPVFESENVVVYASFVSR